MPFLLTMPKLSPTMEEGTIVKWHKKEGEFVEAGDLLLEIATDKATVEYNAIDEGWLRTRYVKEGVEARVNQPIALFSVEQNEEIADFVLPEEPKAAVIPQAAAPSEPEKRVPSAAVGISQPAFAPEPPLASYTFRFPTEHREKTILASPLAKKLAKEGNLDLSTVKGSGPRGRIMSRDLPLAQPSAAATFGKREIPQEIPGSYDETSLTPMRKVIAQRLQEAKTFIPHFYVSQTIDAENLVSCREQLLNTGIKLTYNDFVIRACALALREHPVVNSAFNSQNQTIVVYKTIDISVAVTVEAGLITPIIRHADFKNVGEISVEMKALAKKAKEGTLAAEEYKGGSFTVSNLGMFGVTEFSAIINPPQSSILAIGGILDVPVVRNGAVVPGKVMHVTLSCDHRVVDGVAGAQFLNTVKRYLENPSILLL